MSQVQEILAAEVEKFIQTCSNQDLVQSWEKSGHSQAVQEAVILKLHNLAGPLLQEGPTASLVADMILSKSPRALSGGSLSAREAHSWMHQNEHETPEEWLWHRGTQQHSELLQATQPADIAVIRWVMSVMADPLRREAALRERATAFGGYEIEGSVLSRLDELQAEDLSSSVIQTLEASVNRAIKEEWDGDEELIKPIAWKAPKGIEEIHSFSRLYLEGKSMRHCVAQYASKIHNKEGRILSLHAEDGTRSTAWVTPQFNVTEHRAFANSDPSDACKALAAQATKELKKQVRLPL